MAWSIFKKLSFFAVIPWVHISNLGLAEACSVCFSARGASLRAYYAATVLLIALPLLMMGALAAWIWRVRKNTSQLRGHQL